MDLIIVHLCVSQIDFSGHHFLYDCSEIALDAS